MMKAFTRGDKFVLLFVLLLALLTYILFSSILFAEQPDTVEVFADGKIFATYSLASVNEEMVEIKSKNGTNLLKITKDGAEMTNASCPDKTDVKMGRITKSGQTLICVPNRVVVKLTSKSNDKVDKVAY